MKTTTTKKFFSFILLICGMFSFSIAEAQFICDCTNGQAGICAVDSHGHLKCNRIPHHCGGCTRMASDEPADLSLQVYPNPVSVSTIVSFSLEHAQKVSLSIFDMSGRFVAALADKIFEEGENEFSLNVENMSNGIYFLQFQSEENSEMIKLAVTK